MESIFHFEVPLYRLCNQHPNIEPKVFYFKKAAQREVFDSEYNQMINWGIDLLKGYESQYCESKRSLLEAVRSWGADTHLVYGYGWAGAPQIILQNWLVRRRQIFRGTMNPQQDPRHKPGILPASTIRKYLLRMFQAHHFGGDYSKEALLSAGIPEASLFFVPYSVDSPYFAKASQDPQQIQSAKLIRKNLGWAESNKVVLFLAQHNWIKGPDIALSVFRKLYDADNSFRFLIVGSGHMTRTIQEEAAAHLPSEAIHFAGFIPSTETVPFYLCSDIVICPSRYETWARMVNEAMLCKRPCVASKFVSAAGGLIVHDENGFVVDTPEPKLLQSAILDYFRLPESRQLEIQESARQKALSFSYEKTLDNVLSAARYSLGLDPVPQRASEP